MPTKKRKPLVILYTGNGKGKTTAALGLLLRAWGRGMKVVMLSFIKSETANFGEEQAAHKLGIELIPLGAGFTWNPMAIAYVKEITFLSSKIFKVKFRFCAYDVVVL